MSFNEADVQRAMKNLIAPNTRKDFVSGKSVKNIKVSGNDVSLDIMLGYPAQSVWGEIRAMVEAHLREEDPESVITGPPEGAEKARQGFANWLVWKRQSALHIIAWEKPMLCLHHRYGGTPDHLLNNDPLSIALMDIKCARGIYVENLLQLAAYGHLFEDAGAAIKGYHLGRFSPEQADFSHHFFADLKDAFEMFVLLRQAYDLDKRLKARV